MNTQQKIHPAHYIWDSIQTLGLLKIAISSSLAKRKLFYKCAVVNTTYPLNILPPLRKKFQLPPDHLL
jgi:hypothetical protein